jgi:hypothetical protein
MKPQTDWANAATREAYYDLLDSIDDPLDFARGWHDMIGREAAIALADRLRDDARQFFEAITVTEFERALMLAGLGFVDWHQVASQVIERAAIKAEASTDDDDDEEGGAKCRREPTRRM